MCACAVHAAARAHRRDLVSTLIQLSSAGSEQMPPAMAYNIINQVFASL